MPEMDGLSFLKYLRSHWGQIPFILFTGKGREEVVIDALNSGADFYLQKGGKPQAQFVELEYKIKLAIERQQTIKALQESQQQLSDINVRLNKELDERREIENALRASEKRLQGFVHGSPIPQFVIDKDHRVISWNKALEEYSGVRAQEVLGTTDTWKALYDTARPIMADLLVDGSVDKLSEWYAGRFRPSKYVEEAFEGTDFFPQMGPGGIWLFFTASVIRDSDENIIGAMETLEDITELKQKEEALIESRNYLDKIINTIADPVFVKDRQHRWVLLNDAFCRFMGYSRGDLIGKSDYDFFPKLEADVFWQKDENVFISGIENENEEQFTDGRGTLHTIITKKNLYTDKSGDIFIVGVIRDITDIKQKEIALAVSRNYPDLIFSSVRAGILIIDPEGHTIIDVNPAAAIMIGAPKEEIEGKICHQYICPTNQGCCPITDLGQQGDNSERILVTVTGKHIPIVKYVTQVTIDGRKRLIETFIENTEMKRVDAERKNE